MVHQFVVWLPPEEHPDELSEGSLRFHAARELGVKPAEIAEARIERVSFDARERHMQWRLAVQAWTVDEVVPAAPPRQPAPIEPPGRDAAHVVVIGMGPGGIFAALELLRAGVRVTVLERGKPVQDRRRDVAEIQRGESVAPDSNYAFGEGGAGTYSDGKLYARSGQDAEVRAVLEELVAHDAPPAILTSWRPHVGSNRLPKVVEALRETLLAGGATIRFDCRATRIETQPATDRADGAEATPRVAAVHTAEGERIACDAAVLATGHSAPDALRMAAAAGATLEAKGFAMGVRVEHPQAWLDAHQYHGAKDEAGLPPAFYELSTQARERGVYSFCMCPGGWIVPSQAQPGTLVVNGMSLARRDSPFANSGVVVEVHPKDWCGKRGWRWGWPDLLQRAAAESEHPMLHEVVEDPRGGAPIAVAEGRLPVHPAIDPLFGVRLQVALEVLAAAAGGGGNRAPAQRCDHFVHGEPPGEPLPTSYLPGLTPTDFRALLPKGLGERLREALLAFDAHIPGYAGAEGQLVGVETRTSSPVRLPRDAHLACEGLLGLHPCGEGAGYAGGIVSAALDGRRVAHALAAQLLPA